MISSHDLPEALEAALTPITLRQTRTVSEGCLQACVEGARLGGTERTRIGECRAAIRDVGDSGRIEEGAIGRVAVIENVVDTPIDLKGLVDLIGRAKIEDCIAGQFGCLV